MISWVLLAFLAAFLISLTNIVTKRLNTNLNEYSVGWARDFFSLPIFWIALLISGFPKVDPNFWPLLTLVAPFEVIVAIIYFKAIKSTPLSISIPISSFSSLFIAIGAFFILGEQLKTVYLLAFILMIAGSYLLKIKFEKGYGLFYPFQQLRKDHGAMLMLLA